MSEPLAQRPATRVLALVVVSFGLGYFLSYFLRNVNAVLSPLIVAEFNLTATELGLLTSLYFFAAAAVLVPVAILLDRFGPRRVLIGQMIVTAIGCALFATGSTADDLMIGRTLIGLGVAGGLTTAFKAVTVWFPRERWATGNSLVLGVGSLGVIAGTQPLQFMLGVLDWRQIFWLVVAVCLALAVLLLLKVPDRNAPRTPGQPIAAIYREVLALPVFWRLMPVASLPMAVFFSIQGLWANGWMSDVAGLTQNEIGARLLLMALAMSCGMLINGSISDLLTGLGIPLAAVLSVGIVGLLSAQLILVLQLAPQAYWPWAVMGFTGNIGALGYPLLSRRFPASVSARAMSVLAMSNFGLAFAVQFSTGALLDLFGTDAAGHYPVRAYEIAFSFFLILQMAAFVWFLTARAVWTNPVAPRSP